MHELTSAAAAAASAVDRAVCARQPRHPQLVLRVPRDRQPARPDRHARRIAGGRSAGQHRLRHPAPGRGMGAAPRGPPRRLRGPPERSAKPAGGTPWRSAASSCGGQAKRSRTVRVPDPDDPDARREIDEIPPEEIDLAIARLREASAGLDDEHLIAQVARVFGFDRAGGRIRAVIEQRLDRIALSRSRCDVPAATMCLARLGDGSTVARRDRPAIP